MRVRYLLLLAVLVVAGSTAVSQPMTLTINGVPTGATFTSGDMLNWQITLPPGGTSTNELWVDVNQNGLVNAATDRLIFRFTQQDGMTGNDGPSDMDGMANGTIATQFPAGLAPAKWLFVVSNGATSDSGAFQVLPLAMPAATIVGQVFAPIGADRSYILIQANAGGGGGPMDPFWHALTDVDGNYTIQMGGTPVALNPWQVGLESQQLGRLIPLRGDTSVNVGPTPPVVNFQLVVGTILTGIVVDQFEAPLAGAYPHVHPSVNPEGEGNIGGDTGPDGRYSFAVPPGTWLLHFNRDGYRDQWWNGKTGMMQADVITVTTQDTIWNLDGMLVDAAEIRGVVRNYGSPTNAMVTLFTMPSEMNVMSTSTRDDGSYSFTVDPGTYYVKFQKEGSTQYWNHSNSSPGNAINVMGTETISGIDGDLSVGAPPPPPGPHIVRVWDVPFDNGRQVYVKFVGVEHFLQNMEGGDMPFGVEKYTLWRFDKSGLVYAGTVPAAHDSVYIGIVPTIVDSTITDGVKWSRYIVKAQFLFNIYVLPSAIDSGYSLDNLAPNVPGGVGSAVAGNDVRLAWLPNPDDDFRYFAVYRSTTENFSVAGVTPLTRTTDASYTDAGAATGTFYYRITATDYAGNESAPSNPVSSSGTTAVTTTGGVPSVFALGQNYPNPFNPTTNIVFDVPGDSYVRLEVYNALGQRVAELVAGQVMAGRHTARFDASGLPSGLYVARMTSGEFAATRKINLIK